MTRTALKFLTVIALACLTTGAANGPTSNGKAQGGIKGVACSVVPAGSWAYKVLGCGSGGSGGGPGGAY